ncbi:MAG: oligosaccharide flippase family protein, partial [Pseudomonadaceae bacterium]|nr:oligosaccharide flippase family protein [Pseudomonadaceae bacterium]
MMFSTSHLQPLLISALRVGMLASKFLLALYMARFLGLEALAVFGLVAGAAALLPMLLRMGLMTHLARAAAHADMVTIVYELRMYGSGMAVLYLLAGALALGIGAATGHGTLAALALGVVMAEHVAMDAFSLLNSLRRHLPANGLLFISAGAWIYLYMAAAWWWPGLNDIHAVLLAWMLGGALTMAMAAWLGRTWPWKDAWAKPFDSGWYKQRFGDSWRLFVSDLCTTATTYADRYLLTLFVPLNVVGAYVFFLQVSNAINNLTGASVLLVYRPKLILAAHHEDTPALARLERNVLRDGAGFAALAGLGAAAVMPFLVAFTGREALAAAQPLLWAMLVLTVARAALDATRLGFFARKQDGVLMRANVLALATLVAASALVIPPAGPVGAVFAGCVAVL